jgi:uncharacterized protein YlaI
MKTLAARCLMCGKSYQLDEEYKDFKKLSEKNLPEATFICEMCSNKVRYESDEQRKAKKPASN